MREFRFVELLNPKFFHASKKKFPVETFSTSDVYKNILDLDGLKCELKSVYTASFAKSNIQEVAKMIEELELNQTLAKVTKLLRLIPKVKSN